MKDIMELFDTVRETAFAIHVTTSTGILKKRASRLEHGLLMNFGAPRFEIRKYAVSQIGEDGPGGKLASFLLSVFASFAPFRG